MAQSKAELVGLPGAAGAPAIELRHLRYFTAVADAGSFTHAAEKMFIAQPTLSQQIRRLEQIVGTPLLQRRREGLRLTPAGAVLLDASRAVLSMVDHEVTRTRQCAAGRSASTSWPTWMSFTGRAVWSRGSTMPGLGFCGR
jgi:molybdenum-dependent DNA-binding transcriptional regulator ModE